PGLGGPHRRRAREEAVREGGRPAPGERHRSEEAGGDPPAGYGGGVTAVGRCRVGGRQKKRAARATRVTHTPPVKRPHAQNDPNFAQVTARPPDPAYHSSGPTLEAIGGRPTLNSS